MKLKNRKIPLSNSGFILKFIFTICLLRSTFTSSEANENEPKVAMKINSDSNSEWVELRFRKLENSFLELKSMEKIASKSEESRLSHIEKKLQAQEEKFSALQTKQEFQFNKITDGLNALKSSLFDSKSQNKRAANETSKNSRKFCTDSSRLCTFFYPDHPDVKAAVKSSGNIPSYKAVIQNVLNSDVKTIRGPPTSCNDLKQLGHTLNSYYLVKNPSQTVPNKIQTIYCNFEDVSEKMIGNVELRTKYVHFYVQRESPYRPKKDHLAIPFENEVLNQGGAMNVTSGVFTAPVSGTYHFAFSAVKLDSPDHLTVSIRLNGKEYGRTHTEHFNQDNLTTIKTKSSVSLTALLYLKVGDGVNMRIGFGSGGLFDNISHHTLFTGWLVNEELALD